MPVSSDPARVLVVDDEPVIADTLAEILRHAGFTTRAEYSGPAAMNAAQEFGPQVLIADIVMPGMNGVELAEWYCVRFPVCRVLLVSSNLMHFDPQFLEFPHTGRVSFMPKPVQIPEVIEYLNNSAAVSS